MISRLGILFMRAIAHLPLPAVRAMGHALGWDRGESSMDLENDLFGSYTLVEKPQK